tara:strand:- start:594 stop:854 length:261 start_codon:yes stop_codon:yes gene_type:complete
MSTYEQKPNSFSLFKNEQKQEEKQPDYSGTMTDASGKQFRISAWVNEAKSTGKKYLGGLISEMQPSQTKPVTPPKEDTSFSDDLPF